MRDLRAILLRYQETALNLENVVGIGLGYKERAGYRSTEPAIVVMVEKKLPRSMLRAESVIPAEIEGIITDVMEVGKIALLSRTGFERPARPGVSIGHFRVSAGTLGAVVLDRRTQTPLILSNNHVLANKTNGRDGRSAIGDPILQPGLHDGGKVEEPFAQLWRFVPLYYYPYSGAGEEAALLEGSAAKDGKAPPLQLYRTMRKNYIDAAVAKPLSPEAVNPEIVDIGPVTGMAEATVGMKVQKSGRTSGLTQGTVKLLHATVKVDMGENTYAVFEDQVVATLESKPGDSGSLMVDDKHRAVGLLFAGSPEAAMCNPIQNVCQALDIVFPFAPPGVKPDSIKGNYTFLPLLLLVFLFTQAHPFSFKK